MKLLRSLIIATTIAAFPANAATIAITQGSGTNMGGSLDGSGDFLYGSVLCGNATVGTLYGTVANCAVVNASGQILTLTTITGTVTTVNPSVSAFGAPGPASGNAIGANGPGTFDPLIQTHTQKAIELSTAATTTILPAVASQSIYITSWDVQAPSGTFQLIYGIQTQTFNATFATNVMTLASAPTGSEGVFAGELIAAAGVTVGTTVVALTGGTPNTIGATYSLSTTPGTLLSRSVTATGNTPCNTGAHLTGAYTMSGGQIGKGVGLGPVFVTPANVNVCAVTSAAVQYNGSISYVQF